MVGSDDEQGILHFSRNLSAGPVQSLEFSPGFAATAMVVQGIIRLVAVAIGELPPRFAADTQ